jgi:hypothetical protein
LVASGAGNLALPLAKAAASFNEDGAKVWIHQGLWARRARADVTEIEIAEREKHKSSTDEKVRKLVRYGSKLPEHERRIDFIGAWIDRQGRPVREGPSCQGATNP